MCTSVQGVRKGHLLASGLEAPGVHVLFSIVSPLAMGHGCYHSPVFLSVTGQCVVFM